LHHAHERGVDRRLGERLGGGVAVAAIAAEARGRGRGGAGEGCGLALLRELLAAGRAVELLAALRVVRRLDAALALVRRRLAVEEVWIVAAREPRQQVLEPDQLHVAHARALGGARVLPRARAGEAAAGHALAEAAHAPA